MISKKTGIRIKSDSDVIADGKTSEDFINFVSHAHSDHAVKKDAKSIICSKKTRQILESRYGIEIEIDKIDSIDLISSGHIIGSKAALIDDRILYTGDVSLQDRVYMDGFQPVDAETLIIESTYGIPAYRIKDQRAVVNEIKDWVQDTDENLFLFGYSLGKAQKIQKIVQEATDRPIIAHGSVLNMNEAIEDVTDLKFRAKSYKENKDLLEDNGVFFGPQRISRAGWVKDLVEKTNGIKAGFSGWAVDESFKYRGGYDKTFQLSDHCGFEDLLRLVEKVDPKKVYTHHGFDEAFASYLKREKGFNARALKNNQSSLDCFI